MSIAQPGPSGAEDASLLRAFAEHEDRRALGLLFTRHADTAYRFALRLTGHPPDAEDAVQTAFLQVFHHAGSFKGESAVKSWILGFVLNACRTKSREERRRKERQDRAAEEKDLAASSPVADSEDREQVRRAVQDLPEHYRAPIWLHYAEGYTSGEVADALQIPEDTVRKQLSRGIDRLREVLAPTGAALSLAAILPTLAVETAPSTLTASLAGIASGSAPLATAVKVGAAAKFAAAGVAAMTIATTVSLFWWGERRENPRPPDRAEIDRLVREWQPTPEERRFDEIAWASGIQEAESLSQKSGRPVVLLTGSGRIEHGRADGGSLRMRAGPLSDPRVIDLLNGSFVPVFISNVDYDDQGSASSGERKELRRIWQEAHDSGLPSGMDLLYLLDSPSGGVLDSMYLSRATRESVAAWLEGHRRSSPGEPLVRPTPRSVPPPSTSNDLVLHVAARYLDEQGQVERVRTTYHEFPAEDWMVLSEPEWKGLLAGGTVDPGLSRRFLTTFHPVDMSVGESPDGRNRFDETSLTVTFVSPSLARLDGRLRMARSFTQFSKTEERPIQATLQGYLETDPERSTIRSLRMIAKDASFGRERFAVALRSIP
jgi:RNA polymerase sigma-70 factor (ECF subfamily)